MTDSTAQDEIKAFFSRWLSLEEEKQRIADDLKELFKESKGRGFGSKELREAFRRKVKEDEANPADAEFEAVVDVYLDALNAPKASTRDARLRARENIEEFDPETGEILDRDARRRQRTSEAMDDNIALSAEMLADGLISEEAHAENIAISNGVARKYGNGPIQSAPATQGEAGAQETHVRSSTNDEASPEAGPQAEASPAGTGAGTLADREGRSDGEAVSADLPTNPEFDPTEDREEGQSLDSGLSTAGANAGGEDVTSSAERAPGRNENSNSSGPDDKRATNSPETATTSGVGPLPGAAGADGTHEPATDEQDAEKEDCSSDTYSVPVFMTLSGTFASSKLPRDEDADGVRYESVPPMPMKTLGYAHCFPELTQDAFQRLKADIEVNGVLEPIVRMGDVIVDGWNRYNAARSLKIEYPVICYSGKDVLTDVIKWQRSSRDWYPAQERKIAAALAKQIPHRADDIRAAFHITDEEEVA
ncbi:DUF2312 domain-containing protein [Neorhizobium sp. P12A]|uniref:GapR family DNA-binding domain-containing protein n=1 Tax=Neorhizobium sp. P12A TaxID=2268027 RepID=UPI0011EDA846|nr:GapR family DNA-binding domain-containing protein [Neorhizobium sp. P12A]KAA0684551.1 DUF2312 domain-containing protein [Neorhizobium sp. P12A]